MFPVWLPFSNSCQQQAHVTLQKRNKIHTHPMHHCYYSFSFSSSYNYPFGSGTKHAHTAQHTSLVLLYLYAVCLLCSQICQELILQVNMCLLASKCGVILATTPLLFFCWVSRYGSFIMLSSSLSWVQNCNVPNLKLINNKRLCKLFVFSSMSEVSETTLKNKLVCKTSNKRKIRHITYSYIATWWGSFQVDDINYKNMQNQEKGHYQWY